MSKLQIWWIIGRDFGRGTDGFTHKVKNEQDAGMLLTALANFDLALDEISDNVGGLNEWDEEEWVTYYNEDGDDFDYVMAENEEADPSYYVPTTVEDFKLVAEVLAKYAKYVFNVRVV